MLAAKPQTNTFMSQAICNIYILTKHVISASHDTVHVHDLTFISESGGDVVGVTGDKAATQATAFQVCALAYLIGK